MSFLKKLFGGGGGDKAAAAAAQAEDYNDYKIHPEPVNEGGTWRIAARIEKDIGGEVKTHKMMRADTLQTSEDAVQASVAKAKMLIDQQGDTIFD